MTRRLLASAALALSAGLLVACEPEPGSPEWCEDMKQTPSGEWTANDAAEFAKSCALEDLNEGVQNLLDQNNAN